MHPPSRPAPARSSLKTPRPKMVDKDVLEKAKISLESDKLLEDELSKPWMNQELRNEIIKKHQLLQQARINITLENWSKFRKQCSKVEKLQRKFQLIYEGKNPETEQYEPGFTSKIWQLNTPQDIKKWKEERKKLLLPPGNIDVQQAKEAAKIVAARIARPDNEGLEVASSKNKTPVLGALGAFFNNYASDSESQDDEEEEEEKCANQTHNVSEDSFQTLSEKVEKDIRRDGDHSTEVQASAKRERHLKKDKDAINHHSKWISPSRHHPSPEAPSSVSSSRSPVSSSRSPVSSSHSPVHHSRSPVSSSHSPVRHSRSPVHRSRSPVCRSRSPVHRSRSPVHRSRSPVHRSRSPVHRSRSPVHRSRSPVHRSHSPVHRSHSPVRHSSSPVHRSSRRDSCSPVRHNKGRSKEKDKGRQRKDKDTTDSKHKRSSKTMSSGTLNKRKSTTSLKAGTTSSKKLIIPQGWNTPYQDVAAGYAVVNESHGATKSNLPVVLDILGSQAKPHADHTEASIPVMNIMSRVATLQVLKRASASDNREIQAMRKQIFTEFVKEEFGDSFAVKLEKVLNRSSDVPKPNREMSWDNVGLSQLLRLKRDAAATSQNFFDGGIHLKQGTLLDAVDVTTNTQQPHTPSFSHAFTDQAEVDENIMSQLIVQTMTSRANVSCPSEASPCMLPSPTIASRGSQLDAVPDRSSVDYMKYLFSQRSSPTQSTAPCTAKESFSRGEGCEFPVGSNTVTSVEELTEPSGHWFEECVSSLLQNSDNSASASQLSHSENYELSAQKFSTSHPLSNYSDDLSMMPPKTSSHFLAWLNEHQSSTYQETSMDSVYQSGSNYPTE